jgi:hypothetical protein
MELKTGISDKQSKLSFSIDKGEGTRSGLEPETQGLCAKGISPRIHILSPLQKLVQASCITRSLILDGCMVYVEQDVCRRILRWNAQTRATNAFEEYLRNFRIGSVKRHNSSCHHPPLDLDHVKERTQILNNRGIAQGKPFPSTGRTLANIMSKVRKLS